MARNTTTKTRGSSALATWDVGGFTINTGGELPKASAAPNANPHTFPWDALAARAADRPHFDVNDAYWLARSPDKPVPKDSLKWDRVRRSFEQWQTTKDLSPVEAAMRASLTVLKRYNQGSITVWVALATDKAAAEAAK